MPGIEVFFFENVNNNCYLVAILTCTLNNEIFFRVVTHDLLANNLLNQPGDSALRQLMALLCSQKGPHKIENTSFFLAYANFLKTKKKTVIPDTPSSVLLHFFNLLNFFDYVSGSSKISNLFKIKKLNSIFKQSLTCYDLQSQQASSAFYIRLNQALEVIKSGEKIVLKYKKQTLSPCKGTENSGLVMDQTFQRLPPILVLVNEYQNEKKKLLDTSQFAGDVFFWPLIAGTPLEISQECATRKTYKLRSVILFSSTDCGHFSTLIFTRSQDIILIDDSSSKKISQKELKKLLKCHIYILILNDVNYLPDDP